jgi:predicted PurR-regulated permease PerM
MHPLLILFSTLGGLVIFGISGFIIGPIITALLLSLWEMYEQYFHQELENDN